MRRRIGRRLACGLAVVTAFGAVDAVASPAASSTARARTCHQRFTYAFRVRGARCTFARRLVTHWIDTPACAVGDGAGSDRRRSCAILGYRCRARLGTIPPPVGGTGALAVCARRGSRITFDRPI